MKKKVLALLLAVFMVSGTVLSPMNMTEVKAEEATEENSENQIFRYKVLEDGTIEITGLEDYSVKELIIPSEIDGKKVTSIGEEAFYGEYITSVEIPDTVTHIGDYAFGECERLVDVIIPGSVTSIAGDAFSGTPWLESQREANPLVVVNHILIDGTTASGDVKVPEGVTSISEEAFSYAENINSIAIPDSVTYIGEKAFYWCTNLAEISIPENITYVGYQAFRQTAWIAKQAEINPLVIVGKTLIYGKTASGDVVIPEIVTSIERDAFIEVDENGNRYGADNITSITMSDSVKEIGDWAFDECENLKSVRLSENLTSIGRGTFAGCSSLEEISIPNSVTEIKKEAFYYCSSLKTVKLSDSINKIESSVFSGCTMLTDIVIPESVISIEEAAFSYCQSLKKIIIPDSVVSIAHSVFFGCSSLEEIIIPESVTSIGNAFTSTLWLTNKQKENPLVIVNNILLDGTTASGTVEIPEGVKKIVRNCFVSCSGIESVKIPKSVTDIESGSVFLDCANLKEVIVDEENEVYTSENGMLYSKDKTILLFCPMKVGTEIVVPEGVTEIGTAAFSYRTITAIHLPKTLTKVADYSFSATRINKIYYAGTLKQWNSFPKGVFNDCLENISILEYMPYEYRELEDGTLEITSGYWGSWEDYAGAMPLPLPRNVEVPAEIDGKAVTGIADSAFSNAYNVGSITIPKGIKYIGSSALSNCVSLHSVIIDAEITSIKSETFSGCNNLCSVTLPETLTCIEEGAFSQCRSLTAITIPEAVTCIKMSVFSSCSSLTAITIPEAVTSIENNAFGGCSSLAEIHIPETVTDISSGAFSGTKWLSNQREISPWVVVNGILIDAYPVSGEVTIPEKVTSIAGNVFSDDSDITSVVIPEGLTAIGEHAFWYCFALKSITIPSSVTTMGNGVVEECESLLDVYYNGTKEQWANISNMKHNLEFKSVTIHCTDGIIEPGIFRCRLLPDETVCIEGLVKREGVTEIVIPSEIDGIPVTVIGAWAFEGCSSLKNITIPDTITEMAGGVFDDTQWLADKRKENPVVILNGIVVDGETAKGDIVIPRNVKLIANAAFSYNADLKSVTFLSGIEKTGSAAFSGCENLEKVILSDTIKTISQHTFDECANLKSIEIPISVKSVEYDAFYGCRNLTDVYYEGTKEQWKKIAVAIDDEEYYGNNRLLNATIHYNSVMTVPDIDDDNTGNTGEETNPAPDDENQNGENVNPTPDDGNQNGENVNPTPDTNQGTNNNNTPAPVALNKISVSKAEVTYNGKAQTPTITVVDANGQPVDAANYIVVYSNNKNVGQATVSVTGKNNYTGTMKATFNILPKGTNLSKVTAKKKAVAVKWKKQTKQTTGYEIQYSTSKKFKGAKTANIKKAKTTSTTIKKLKAKKKYYVRIRTYKTVKINGKSTKLYSGWSNAKSVKVK
ncbi:MAG: leucine-rich repeat protein [Lachnospiraceae bacterium]|nr:leucine-rich repeat protein [Lachnospiraceae bacterium]